MYFFYIDESGSADPHHEPLPEGETPLFCLTALSVHESKWRRLDRDYLYLKREFFAEEIGTRRAEYYEIKGRQLVSPHGSKSRRKQEFLRRALRICDGLDIQAFSMVVVKNSVAPASKKMLYGLALQYLVERLHLFLEGTADDSNGIMIIDSRSRDLDDEIARAHLSFLFGHKTGRSYYKMLEAPLFADSKLTAGLQMADIIGGAVYANYMNRECRGISGVGDYSGITSHWPLLDTIQFKGPPSRDGHITYGFRVLNWKS